MKKIIINAIVTIILLIIIIFLSIIVTKVFIEKEISDCEATGKTRLECIQIQDKKYHKENK